MRIRRIAALVLLLLPAASSAQRRRIPTVEGRRPGEPVPLSPQPAPIARELGYRRLRVSIESYPLITYAQAPGFTAAGGSSARTSFGAGTRAEYRLSPHAAATMDMTSSFAGSPVIVQTAEIGTRFGPERSDDRLYPFLDLRVGYISAYDRSLGSSNDNLYGYPTQGVYGARYSNGFGGVAGAGVEYALTRTFSLTTSGSVMRSHMTARDFGSTQTVVPSFAMTSFRYTIGAKYNPVRMLMP